MYAKLMIVAIVTVAASAMGYANAAQESQAAKAAYTSCSEKCEKQKK